MLVPWWLELQQEDESTSTLSLVRLLFHICYFALLSILSILYKKIYMIWFLPSYVAFDSSSSIIAVLLCKFFKRKLFQIIPLWKFYSHWILYNRRSALQTFHMTFTNKSSKLFQIFFTAHANDIFKTVSVELSIVDLLYKLFIPKVHYWKKPNFDADYKLGQQWFKWAAFKDCKSGQKGLQMEGGFR